MATRNSRRKIYKSVVNGNTAIDLTKVCAYVVKIHTTKIRTVDFHMDSGTIFSVRMHIDESKKLHEQWEYWRED